MLGKTIMILAVLVAILGFMPAKSFGQGITGTIVGTVSDSSGGVIPNVSVTATNTATGVVYRTATGPEGFYTMSNVPPGRYDIKVSSAGSRTGVSSGNDVNVERTTRVDFTLSPGTVSETVQVTATTPLVETTTSDIGRWSIPGKLTTFP